MNERIVVADAGPLIALAKLDRLELLEGLFREVLVPQAVIDECTRDSGRADARRIRAILEQQHAFAPVGVTGSRKLHTLSRLLDPGEAQVLLIAAERRLPALIDERKERQEARRIGIDVIGTGAVLVAAKRRGMVAAVQPLLEQMVRDGYRLSERLRQALLEQSGEA